MRTDFHPCLFDLSADPREETNLASTRPALLSKLWGLLNTTHLTQFKARSPPHLLGPCHPRCAAKHWRKLGASVVTPEEAGEEWQLSKWLSKDRAKASAEQSTPLRTAAAGGGAEIAEEIAEELAEEIAAEIAEEWSEEALDLKSALGPICGVPSCSWP